MILKIGTALGKIGMIGKKGGLRGGERQVIRRMGRKEGRRRRGNPGMELRGRSLKVIEVRGMVRSGKGGRGRRGRGVENGRPNAGEIGDGRATGVRVKNLRRMGEGGTSIGAVPVTALTKGEFIIHTTDNGGLSITLIAKQ